MARNLGMGILRLIAVIGGVTILAFVVLTAGTILMPGTKVRKLFGANAETLAGQKPWNEQGPLKHPPRTMKEFAEGTARADEPDAGTPDAGTLATAPGSEQGSAAPAQQAQPLPEDHGK